MPSGWDSVDHEAVVASAQVANPKRGAQKPKKRPGKAAGTNPTATSPGPLAQIKLHRCTHKSYITYFCAETGKWPLVIEIPATRCQCHDTCAETIFEHLQSHGLTKDETVTLRNQLVAKLALGPMHEEAEEEEAEEEEAEEEEAGVGSEAAGLQTRLDGYDSTDEDGSSAEPEMGELMAGCDLSKPPR